MNNENEADWISELPESILHHILSFIDLKFAIQTSILSTKWRYIWKSLPFLKFYSIITKEGNLGFDDFVDNVLNLRDNSSSIQRFHLLCDHNTYDDVEDCRSRWIITALESNVEDLFISLVDQFKFPPCLFTCKSLRKLELIIYGHKLNLPDSMNLPRLNTLILIGVGFDGNDDDIPNKIISSCPVLESLEFRGCIFYRTTVDINAPQLKHLVFRFCNILVYHKKIDLNKYIIKLNAPNLVSFSCNDNMFKDYCLVNVSALVKAEIIMSAKVYDMRRNSILDDEIRQVFVQRMFKLLRALHNVETLTLSAWFIEVVSGVPDLLKSKSIQFSNLRCLKLSAWLSRDCITALTHLLKVSPNIESLFLQVTEDIIEKEHIHPFFDKVRFDIVKTEGDWEAGALLHLKFVKIQGVRGCLSELQFLEILLKNGIVLEKVIIQPPRAWGKELPREFVQQLLTLPRASSSIEFELR